MKPRSIDIFLLDGDPNGIKVAQIATSTIQAIACHRLNRRGNGVPHFPMVNRWLTHSTGNGSISPGSIIPSGCSPSGIAPTISGGSSVSRNRRET